MNSPTAPLLTPVRNADLVVATLPRADRLPLIDHSTIGLPPGGTAAHTLECFDAIDGVWRTVGHFFTPGEASDFHDELVEDGATNVFRLDGSHYEIRDCDGETVLKRCLTEAAAMIEAGALGELDEGRGGDEVFTVKVLEDDGWRGHWDVVATVWEVRS